MATPGESTKFKFMILLKKMGRGGSLAPDDASTIKKILSEDPNVSLTKINEILAAVDKSTGDKKQYSEMLKMITDYVQTKLTAEQLKTDESQKIIIEVYSQLSKITKTFGDVGLSDLVKNAGAKIKSIFPSFDPESLQASAAASVVAALTVASQNGNEGSNPAATFVSAFKQKATQMGGQLIQQAKDKATELVGEKAATLITEAIFKNMDELKTKFESFVSSDIVKNIVKLNKIGDQLNVLSKNGEKMIATFEMGKIVNEAASVVKCTLSNDAFRSIASAIPGGTPEPNKELLAVIRMVAASGKEPLNLENTSNLSKVLETCRTAAEADPPIKINVITDNPAVKEAVRALGAELTKPTKPVTFLQEEVAADATSRPRRS